MKEPQIIATVMVNAKHVCYRVKLDITSHSA